MQAKKLRGGWAARKSPIDSTNNQWGDAPPLIKVSLIIVERITIMTEKMTRMTQFVKEEIANAITHSIGAILSIPALIIIDYSCF